MNKKEKVGLLAIFEGIDHVGKSTIVDMVSKELTKIKRSHSQYSFPGKKTGTLGRLIYDLHHDNGSIKSEFIDNESKQILHVAAHIDTLKKDIIPDLKEGKIVLLDRSWWSTIAYGIGDGLGKETLNDIILPEKKIIDKIENIIYFYIIRKDIEQDFDNNKAICILQAYDELCQSEKQYVVKVKNNDSLESVTKFIVDTIMAYNK